MQLPEVGELALGATATVQARRLGQVELHDCNGAKREDPAGGQLGARDVTPTRQR